MLTLVHLYKLKYSFLCILLQLIKISSEEVTSSFNHQSSAGDNQIISLNKINYTIRQKCSGTPGESNCFVLRHNDPKSLSSLLKSKFQKIAHNLKCPINWQTADLITWRRFWLTRLQRMVLPSKVEWCRKWASCHFSSEFVENLAPCDRPSLSSLCLRPGAPEEICEEASNQMPKLSRIMNPKNKLSMILQQKRALAALWCALAFPFSSHFFCTSSSPQTSAPNLPNSGLWRRSPKAADEASAAHAGRANRWRRRLKDGLLTNGCVMAGNRFLDWGVVYISEQWLTSAFKRSFAYLWISALIFHQFRNLSGTDW